MVTRAHGGPTLLATMVLLGGCGAQALRAEPPAYMDGYYDGCDIGAAMLLPGTVMPEKNEARYTADAAYRRGWEFGYAECYFEIDAILGD